MLCTGLYALVVCVKSPHALVPRTFGFLTQTTRAYNPVRRTFYDVNYICHRVCLSEWVTECKTVSVAQWPSTGFSRGRPESDITLFFYKFLILIFYSISKTNTYTTHNTNILTFAYSHYLYKQTRRTLALLTILTLYLHLHCTTHTYIIYTRTNYNTYTISNHQIRLEMPSLQCTG